jgi:hypothetical protein
MPITAQHSKETSRWGTPSDIIARCKGVVGAFDLDPCTEAKFESVVGARVNYSLLDRGEDGLTLPWFGRVFCNPPGGLVREFWCKALESDSTAILWIGFSVEQLCTLTDCVAHPMDFSCCLLRQRIHFTRHDGYSGSPSHGNYVAGLQVKHALFKEQFSSLGRVSAGKYAMLL